MMEIIHFLNNNLFIFYLIVGLFSICIGSFLNVVIYRLPKILDLKWKAQSFQYLYPGETPPESTHLSLSKPRSACPSCSNQLKWQHNIPVISWIALKGKCGFCEHPISARYPLIEILTMTLSVVVAYKFGVSLNTLFGVLFTQISIALFFIDWDHQILPDRLVFPLIGLGLLINSQSLFVSPEMAIIGAIAGFMSLWSIYIIMKLITGREGMGYGDFKYLSAIGAWFGPTILGQIFIVSAFSGIAMFLTSLLIAKIIKSNASVSNAVPFGPHLAIAAWFVLITM